MLRQTIRNLPGMKFLIDLNVVREDWWFDAYHHVDTAPEIAEQVKRGWRQDPVNHHYLPIRPRNAHRLLQSLPLSNYREYTFVDYGSGKGRMLMLAAEYDFKIVRGLELRREFHERACQNFRQFRNGKLKQDRAESVHIDATEYQLPDEKQVIYLFNPFGVQVMQQVLQNIASSLDRAPRDVLVVFDYPVYAALADQLPQLKLELETTSCKIYRSRSEKAVLAAGD